MDVRTFSLNNYYLKEAYQEELSDIAKATPDKPYEKIFHDDHEIIKTNDLALAIIQQCVLSIAGFSAAIYFAAVLPSAATLGYIAFGLKTGAFGAVVVTPFLALMKVADEEFSAFEKENFKHCKFNTDLKSDWGDYFTQNAAKKNSSSTTLKTLALSLILQYAAVRYIIPLAARYIPFPTPAQIFLGAFGGMVGMYVAGVATTKVIEIGKFYFQRYFEYFNFSHCC